MPSRKEIKPKVIGKIASTVHLDPSKIREKQDLEDDLGMGSTVRRAMAMPYNGIISEYENGVSITFNEAGDLKTVKESIDLVTRRSNGDDT